MPYVDTRSSVRPSVYDIVSVTKPFDGVLQNSAQRVLRVKCDPSDKFLQIGSMTLRNYPYSPYEHSLPILVNSNTADIHDLKHWQSCLYILNENIIILVMQEKS